MLTNMDKLYESVAANGPVCVGLDTEISYLPTTDTARTAGENVVAFNRALIDATKGVAGCYKVQIAYYESLGLDGMRAYAETLKMARATGLPVIADIKRGDIAKTAEMYAKAHFTAPANLLRFGCATARSPLSAWGCLSRKGRRCSTPRAVPCCLPSSTPTATGAPPALSTKRISPPALPQQQRAGIPS